MASHKDLFRDPCSFKELAKHCKNILCQRYAGDAVMYVSETNTEILNLWMVELSWLVKFAFPSN